MKMFLYAEAGTYKKISYKRRDIVMNVDLEGVIRIFCLISGVSAIITGILRIILVQKIAPYRLLKIKFAR